MTSATLVSTPARPPAAARSRGLPGPGETLVGKYQIVRELGRGGMGVVVEARDLRLGRRVAIKMIAPGAWQAPELVARFEREARAAARLQSPYAVRLLDVDVAKPEQPFLVMEYLEGRGLDEELAERGPLPVGEAAMYVRQACEAMAEAHAAGIVHRDLKPSNLFVCRDGVGRRTLKVLDFGIAKLLDEHDDGLTLTRSGFGTPEYMAPEQVRADGPIDGRSDVWSLGVVLFQLLAGTLPFEGVIPSAVLVSIVNDDLPSVRTLRADVPPMLEAALARALCKDPRKRFRSAGAFAEALAPFASRRLFWGAAADSIAAQRPSRPRAWWFETTGRSLSARSRRFVVFGLASMAAGAFGVGVDRWAEQGRPGVSSQHLVAAPAPPPKATSPGPPPSVEAPPVAPDASEIEGPKPSAPPTPHGKAPNSGQRGGQRPHAASIPTAATPPIGPDGHPVRL